jgi:hypothetical protein
MRNLVKLVRQFVALEYDDASIVDPIRSCPRATIRIFTSWWTTSAGMVGSTGSRRRTADLETVILDLLDGQYKDPVRIVAFNTFEGWSQDVSTDIAQELRRRCDLQMSDVPSSIQDVERHDELDQQLTLRLA